ncbi:hypothetical protein BDV95DRAFT_612898 [Massariosphaeria phaeospora]|uniref:Cora-like Mg2+ transporter protein-domain-containing protein n=1 Tax=Massariosphaeria phaeospora TaxID=100035 RepID=A0A7C8I4S8_9PLEO|nr:hypothetical protein BDV95DRAFT_612898 [Massariosphaeria phaeospora]
MDEHRYQKALCNPTTFEAQHDLAFIETHTYEATENSFETGRLADKAVGAWLVEPPRVVDDAHSKRVASLRIIACVGPPRHKNRRTPLNLSRETYELITAQWQLPRSFLHLLTTRRACFSTFEGESREDSDDRSYSFQTVDKGGHPFAGAVTHQNSERTTLVFLCGLLEKDLSLLCEELKGSRALVGIPTFVPMCLLEMKTERVEESLEESYADIYKMKVKTRMTSNADDDFAGVGTDDSDFVSVSRSLTEIFRSLAKNEFACEAHLHLLDRLDEENLRLFAYSARMSYDEKAMRTIEKRNRSLRSWMQTLGPQTRYHSQRSQAYVQTVYSLIAQHDNALNIKTAEASLRVSEISYRDSAAMKAIAEDSKQVALATWRDSSLMYIVAILTLIFLPPTFTATLFSTQFFDFKFSSSGSVVSYQFWLYWAVTIALTALTFGSAGYFWRARDRKVVETFLKRDAIEDAEKMQSMGRQ